MTLCIANPSKKGFFVSIFPGVVVEPSSGLTCVGFRMGSNTLGLFCAGEGVDEGGGGACGGVEEEEEEEEEGGGACGGVEEEEEEEEEEEGGFTPSSIFTLTVSSFFFLAFQFKPVGFESPIFFQRRGTKQKEKKSPYGEKEE